MKELDPEDIELIEKYISQTCTRNEEQLFLEKEASDPEFKERAELFKSIYENKEIDSNEFESVLDEIHEELKDEIGYQQMQVRPLATRGWWKIAAAVLLIMVSVVVVRLWLPPTNPIELYSSNFQVPPENITTRDYSEKESNLIQAIQFYKENNYQEAIEEFSSYLDQDDDHTGARFYLGISLMKTENFETAMNQFDEVLNQADNQYESSAHWYAGLAALRLDKVNIAEKHFRILANGTGSYSVRAKEILEELD